MTATTSSVFRSGMLLMVARVSAMAVSLVVIPLVVGEIGIEGYGSWETIYASAVILNILQSTLGGTILWLVSQTQGSTRLEKLSEYIGGALGMVAVSCLLVIPMVFVFREQIVGVLGMSDKYSSEAQLVLPLLISAMLAGGLNEILSAVVSGTQNAGAAALVLAGATILSNLVALPLLMLGCGLTSMLVGVIVAQCFSFIALRMLLCRIVPGLCIKPRLISKRFAGLIAPYWLFLLFGSISILMRDNVDKIILANLGGADATAFYAISTRLGGTITMLAGFIYIPIIAASGALFGANKQQELGEMYQNVSSFLLLAVGSMAVLVGGLLEPLVVLWMGSYNPQIHEYFYWILAGNVVAVVVTGPGSAMAKGMGLKRPESSYIGLCIVLNILLKVTLIPYFGAPAAVWSSAISWSLGSVLFVVLLRKSSLAFSTNIGRLAVSILLIVCFIIIGRLIAGQFGPYTTRTDAFGMLVFGGTALLIAFTAAMFAVGDAQAIKSAIFVMRRRRSI